MIRIGERIVDLFQLQPGTSVTARGWVKTLRNSKETGFIQLTDGSCFKDLQVVVDGGVKYQTRRSAMQDIFQWIETWYNRHRRHSYLGYESPVNFEKASLRPQPTTTAA